MALDLNTLRNVKFADLRSPDVELGGLLVTSGMTNAIFYTIVAIAIDQDAAKFGLQDSSNGEAVARDDSPLRPGLYLIVSDQPATSSKKAFFTRAMSKSTGTRLESFKNQADYKIVRFKPDTDDIAGQHLDRRLLDDARRPPDALFNWHFEQAVYANVRGSGEPIPEFDFPPGSDAMGEIMGAPKAAERMQFELFTRLGASHILED
ncbi:MAG: hypothetical protein STHCBS139747_007930 [Sporothrix thermara]